ncbi:MULTISPECIES: YihY/virulence factor BrkB family protein [unclassified Picosynechococcus]|uniref:YihY/virulence factor BrkB family protein n=1 Tax=unclassified Picosynechococcus TaxID=3079910 RepID=UPI0007459491|nr:MULTISPECIES: YihY/virulence factor BrkB family protein [unclassified Picosynechococcus]AMA09403.1 ribonuclease BN-like family protein [Picosynechococcus sp. PCC 73109]ANV90715.1 ribonuclease BN-like family protein [Picosynechococcus sp. PCC 8807]QCS50250.1 YihY/virulence factor BrkB family protein [Picosynechococcus sp. PCC 11901]
MKRFLRFFLFLNHRTLYWTIRQALRRRLLGLSAEIAFNVMLSLFPTIIMALTALGLFTATLDNQTILQLASYYEDVMPVSVWTLLREFAAEISKTPSRSLFSVSFVATIWVSSGALSAAMNALDQIHEIPPEQRRPFWKAKLMSIFITLGAIALLIFASFLVLVGDSVIKVGLDLIVRLPVDTTGVNVLVTLWRLLSFPLALGLGTGIIAMVINILTSPPDRRHPLRKLKQMSFGLVIALIAFFALCFSILFIQNLIVDMEINYDLANLLVILWRFLSLPVALAIVSIAFAFIYSMGSSRLIKGMPILPGAVLGAVSWAIISSLFRLYVANFGQYNRVYGAVGTAIILMLWLQLSALVMLLGDQLNVVVGEAMLADALKRGDRQLNKNPPLPEEAPGEI